MIISYFNYLYDVKGSARGAVHQIESLAEQLRKLGHTVHVHFRNARQYNDENDGQNKTESGGFLNWLKRFNIARRYLNVPKKYLANFKHIGQEKRLIQQDKADVVLAVNTYANFSARVAARRCGVPYVAFCDAPMHYEYKLFWSKYKTYSWLGRRIERRNLQKAAAVTCISEIFKGYLVNYDVPADRITVIPNGANPDLVDPAYRNENIQEKHGLKNKLVIGFIGSFNFFDDVTIIGDMIKRLLADYSEIVFLFVGAGTAGYQLQQKLQEEIERGKVIFTGALPHSQAMEHLSVMDIVFTPYLGNYLFYGSSMKVLEYMAAGKAVIATALGQIKELISTGYNGLLFDWQDYKTLESQFRLAIENDTLRDSMGRHARVTILDGWTWRHQAEKLESVLLKAVSARDE